MSEFFGNVFSVLTTTPGNLVYRLVLAFSIAGALQGAINHWRTSEVPQPRRTILGLGVLLLIQFSLFLVSGISWFGFFDPQTALPPLDRAATLLSLVWITWLWAFPEPVRLADIATGLLSALAGVVLILTTLSWVQRAPSAYFSQTLWEMVWQILALGVIIVGIIALIIRQPNGWGNGLAMLGFAFLGHLIYLLPPLPAGNYPGVIRLLQIATFPVLLTLPQRFTAPLPSPVVSTPEQPTPDRRRFSSDHKTFQSLIGLASETDGEKIIQAITRTIAEYMLADLCFLIFMSEEKDFSIACGFDLIREEYLEGTSLDKEALPLLTNAIQRGKPLRLPASSTSADLKALGQILGLGKPGHILCVPIVSADHGSLGGILILSPYSNRLWNAEDQKFLVGVAIKFVSIILRGQQIADLQRQRDEAHRIAESAEDNAREFERKFNQLSNELETSRQQLDKNKDQASNLSALLATQDDLQNTIRKLQTENEQLSTKLETKGVTLQKDPQTDKELRQAMDEISRLQKSLSSANLKIVELEKNSAAPLTKEQTGVVASMSQELRQPMSSIIGYTDLLLGESVGILGTLQRKFLERIKASTERIGGLVEDLIHVTTMESGQIEIKPEPIDLNLIIDNAVAYTSTQLREKNITLRLDIPEVSPHVQADRESLQQILIHLLQNASAATLVEGTITLRVTMKQENQREHILIQVKDTGGGIPESDLPLVFARRYRAENVLIQGLGDTGVGLSIARSLVEAQNGRIWVETEIGEGSTFNALIPVTQLQPE